jgi:hypothetical protein
MLCYIYLLYEYDVKVMLCYIYLLYEYDVKVMLCYIYLLYEYDVKVMLYYIYLLYKYYVKVYLCYWRENVQVSLFYWHNCQWHRHDWYLLIYEMKSSYV